MTTYHDMHPPPFPIPPLSLYYLWFDMALYKYFALDSVPTRVSKELEEANTIVYGGCVLVTFGHAAHHLTCIA